MKDLSTLPPAAREEEARLLEARRLARRRQWRRGGLWFASVVLLAALIGLMLGHLLRGTPRPEELQLARVLEVRSEGPSGSLELLLDRPVQIRQWREPGAIALHIEATRLDRPASGQLAGSRPLRWRIEPQGSAVQVVLVGLGEAQLETRLEAQGEHWRLRLSPGPARVR